MFDPNPNDNNNQANLLYIWLMVLGLIVVTAIITGVQVYWWQKSVAAAEQKQLLLKIDKLQRDIRRLQQRSLVQNQSAGSQNEDYRKLLAGREQKVIMALHQRDMEKLSSYVHPVKGVRLSPYMFVNTDSDQVFSARSIRSFFQDRGSRVWGYYEDTSTPIKLTNETYFKTYLDDCNYFLADKVGFNQDISGGLTAGNVLEVYPKAIIVEYRYSEGSAGDETSAFRDLKLVFESQGKDWYLTGIIHDQWTM